MTYVETVSIPHKLRGYIIKERDSIGTMYGIKLTFPRGRENMHGDYQGMMISGRGPSAVRNAMPKIRAVMAQAELQYTEFSVRRDERKKYTEKNNTVAPSVAEPVKSVLKIRNGFSALDGLFEQENEQRKLDMAQSAQSAQSAKPAPMNFSAAVTKKSVKPKTASIVVTHMKKSCITPIKQPISKSILSDEDYVVGNWADEMDREDKLVEDDFWFNHGSN